MDAFRETGSVAEYLHALKSSPRLGQQVVHHEELIERTPVFGKNRIEWPGALEYALGRMGIPALYQHQAAATDAIRRGENVIVATPTASGKSLIYNLPVFEQIMRSPDSTALYLFPLKALAQDQLRTLNELISLLPEELRPGAAVYDGDTTAYQRKKLREKTPNILITNPDMLHLSMLGYHSSWGNFFARLSHVILDEVHTYRGIFGSHMAWVLRRLKRICSYYGSAPKFILSSATVANPGELAHDLLGEDAVVISESGAPRARRHFVFINPLDSAATAASQLIEASLKRGLRTIVYTQSRKLTELVSIWTKQRLGPLADKLTSYRAGYLPEERREIEARLSAGSLLGVIATSALELGIDIGDLDICILVGYPGTVMTTWQRGGRVGRKENESLIILLGIEDSLDQHFMRNPKDFFSREVEATVLNPANKTIVRRHLICAAAEQPIKTDEPLVQDENIRKIVEALTAEASLLLTADGKYWVGSRKYPHREVDLRGSGQTFVIRNQVDGSALGEIDFMRSLKECHPGAVYLHRGKTWLITGLELDTHEVTALRKNVNYFTRTLGSKTTEILQTYRTMDLHNFRVSFGYLRVTDTVTGFQRRLVAGQKLISTESLDLPPLVFETEGLWLEIPEAIQKRIEREQYHFMGGIHALEHGAIAIFPLLVLCDRNDVGGIAHPFHEQLSRAAVFIYDGYPGGVGLARKAFEKIDELLHLTHRTINDCTCELGCPSCVHSPKCGSGNRPIDKQSALEILNDLLKNEKKPAIDSKQVPPGSGMEFRVRGPEKQIAQSEPPARYGVFDVETKRSAAEVGGWHRAERMGISVAVLYDSVSGSFKTYLEKDVPDLVNDMQSYELVIGFNNKRFDNRVLSAYTVFNLASLPTLDIMEVITERLGYRLSLDRLAEHTLGVKKSADGLQALQWYKEGKIDEIINYCSQDVKITRDLFLFGLKNRYLLFRNKAGSVVRLPVDFSSCF
ncbi:MAG: DEAD/DEAH box helicase [Deltaproteobacteria bacterium]|jgi:DEAD/DEAH box helicase domain-containing protein|nr:DEAD/DEAH box helicase [Deltaproteobacteria bacterium]